MLIIEFKVQKYGIMNLRHKAGAAEDNINIKCRHHLFFKKTKKSEKKTTKYIVSLFTKKSPHSGESIVI